MVVQPLPYMAQSQGTILPHLFLGGFRQLLGCGFLVQTCSDPDWRQKSPSQQRQRPHSRGRGQDKDRSQPAVPSANRSPVLRSAWSPPQNKVFGSLLAALQKQDKAALTPELQRLLEKQQANSPKLLTKSLHQTTTKQGSARKDLQRLREDRVFLWDAYLEQIVVMMRTQLEEKDKALRDSSPKRRCW